MRTKILGLTSASEARVVAVPVTNGFNHFTQWRQHQIGESIFGTAPGSWWWSNTLQQPGKQHTPQLPPWFKVAEQREGSGSTGKAGEWDTRKLLCMWGWGLLEIAGMKERTTILSRNSKKETDVTEILAGALWRNVRIKWDNLHKNCLKQSHACKRASCVPWKYKELPACSSCSGLCATQGHQGHVLSMFMGGDAYSLGFPKKLLWSLLFKSPWSCYRKLWLSPFSQRSALYLPGSLQGCLCYGTLSPWLLSRPRRTSDLDSHLIPSRIWTEWFRD